MVSGLCQLALIPLLLRLLGTGTFGWVMALVALVGLSQFGDLGVAMALQQKLSEAWARGDDAGLRRTYASGLRLLLGLGLAWFVLAALCLAVFLVVVDNTIVNVALPTLAARLAASNATLQWIVDAYTLPFAGLLLAGGELADRFGRRRVMQLGLVAFSLF